MVYFEVRGCGFVFVLIIDLFWWVQGCWFYFWQMQNDWFGVSDIRLWCLLIR